jgi:heme-degrading monooxygenase HmoA
MYARSSTVQGNPQSLDDAIAYMRDEVMPAVQEMDGCIGLSLMCDRDSGRCIATTAWETEEAMHNSESAVHDKRRRFAEMLGGTPEVKEWEIALLHRVHHAPDGACSRVLWSQGNPADAERVIDALRMNLLARMEDLPGFCSVSMLLDRENGRGATAVVYESRQAMDRALDMAKPLRQEFEQMTGWRFTEIAEFDLALAHLRVPETV